MISKLTRSSWREFAFVLHEVSRAIEPSLGLQEMINNWPHIESELAERNRKRRPQIERAFQTTKTS
jgi:hypothetical protein